MGCRQTVGSSLLKAGHPELIFELDGQCASEPRHWREKEGLSGAPAWLVGQAVALREMSWQLSRETEASGDLKARWSALLWLLQKLEGLDKRVSSLMGCRFNPRPKLPATLKACDEMAKGVSASVWTPDLSRRALQALASASGDFQSPLPPGNLRRARRRLVLALDRLLKSQTDNKSRSSLNLELDRLFELSQSIPDFDEGKFAAL